jgi:hypothetical protein
VPVDALNRIRCFVVRPWYSVVFYLYYLLYYLLISFFITSFVSFFVVSQLPGVSLLAGARLCVMRESDVKLGSALLQKGPLSGGEFYRIARLFSATHVDIAPSFLRLLNISGTK